MIAWTMLIANQDPQPYHVAMSESVHGRLQRIDNNKGYFALFSVIFEA